MTQRSLFLRILAGGRGLSSYTPKIGAAYYGTQAMSSVQEASELSNNSLAMEEDICSGMDWNNLGFGLMETDYMYVMKCGKDDEFKQGKLSRYGNIELSPSAGVLNYGQVWII
ncbi:hypothetical protein BUALT_Bualt08G0032000 [Buddleja alternifolia]|uniref:Uncharacterized protein n=1 Tax=Buddleja alternifolia TaxID=168488 RepID=A0AAV6X3A4_9LAMI|nr:hypothetical protein BUALT_Bualt08G0032000 [Buddleja alternifolia]